MPFYTEYNCIIHRYTHDTNEIVEIRDMWLQFTDTHQLSSYIRNLCRYGQRELIHVLLEPITFHPAIVTFVTQFHGNIHLGRYRCKKGDIAYNKICFTAIVNVTDKVSSLDDELTEKKTNQTEYRRSITVIQQFLDVLSHHSTREIHLVNVGNEGIPSRHNNVIQSDHYLLVGVYKAMVGVATCPDWLYTCKDHTCVHYEQVYDGMDHCVDRSDELMADEVCVIYNGSENWPGSVEECWNCQTPDCLCAGHLYQCPEGGCVSWSRVCDVTVDCIHGGDEICVVTLPISSNSLESVMPHTILNYTTKANNSFYCPVNNISIPIEWVNDLVPDCPIVNTSEWQQPIEYLYRKLDTTSLYMDVLYYAEDENLNQSVSIPKGQFLICHRHSSQYFSLTQLCLLDYDDGGRLKYCRSGQHLKQCDKIDCQDLYKCPGSYCTPYTHYCDTVPDCPQGEDEAECPQYPQSCPGMFRCFNFRCLPQELVCNGIAVEYVDTVSNSVQ